MRVHKRLIDIVNPNAKTIDSLQRIELPAGVDIEIKIQALCPASAAPRPEDAVSFSVPAA